MSKYDPPIIEIIEAFNKMFPEFGDTTNIEISISIYYNLFSIEWGKDGNIWDTAILYLIAHLQTLQIKSYDSTSSQYATATKKVDNVQVTYQVPVKKSELSSFYTSTNYGQTFWILSASYRLGGVTL